MRHNYLNEYPSSKLKRSKKEETQFSTGSKRDNREGKGRNDLLPFVALQKLSLHFERGAQRYDARNWELGQSLSTYFDSAYRHMVKYFLGLRDEDHLSAAIWNLCCLSETEERIRLGILPEELDDLPDTYKDEKFHKDILQMFGEA